MREVEASQSAGGGVRMRRQALAALALLSLVNLLNYYDRLIVTVVAEPVKRQFGLTDTQLGLLTGPAFVTVYVLAGLVFGWLADRASRKWILVGIISLWSVLTMAGGFARNFAQLAISRAGVGVGEGGSHPSALSLLTDYFPRERRSTAVSIFNAVGMVGILASFLLGGWIAETYGWRAALLVAGPPGLLLALVVALLLREPARDAGAAEVPEAPPFRTALAILWRIPAYPWLIAAIGFGTFGNLGMLQWVPLFFIRSHGLGLSEVGLFFGPTMVCGLILGLLAGGWAGDRLARKSTGAMLNAGIFANAAAVPVYWAALWVPWLELALGLTLIAAALSVFYSPAIIAVVQTVSPAPVRGTSIAIYNLVPGILGAALFPFLVGMLSDALQPSWGAESLRVSLTVMIATLLLSLALYVKARRLIE